MQIFRSLGVQINTFEETVSFMGFSLVDSIHGPPRHFS